MPTNEAIVGIAQNEFGAQVAWLMILGFAISLLLARFTPLHYVFLTGHHTLFMATLLTIVLATAGLPGATVVAVGGLLLGIVMVSLPAISQPWTKRITGDDSIAIGHFGTLGYIAAGITGRFTGGSKSRSTEDLKPPEGLRFLRDSMVATALSMVLMYLAVSLIYLAKAGGGTAFEAFADESGAGAATDVGNYLMMGVTQGLSFGVAVAVILFGVRTILGELVPAFQASPSGWCRARCPPSTPRSCSPRPERGADRVRVQFRRRADRPRRAVAVAGTGVRTCAGAAGTGSALLHRQRRRVYGNATGGRRGAVAGGFVNGLIITFLPALLVRVLGSFGSQNTTFGDADFGWYGILLGNAAKLGPVWGVIAMLAIGAGLLALAVGVQRRLVDTDWDPSPGRPLPSAGEVSAAPSTLRSYARSRRRLGRPLPAAACLSTRLRPTLQSEGPRRGPLHLYCEVPTSGKVNDLAAVDRHPVAGL